MSAMKSAAFGVTQSHEYVNVSFPLFSLTAAYIAASSSSIVAAVHSGMPSATSPNAVAFSAPFLPVIL